GEGVDEAVEERLCGVVDPVEVLEHQQEGLHLALPEEQGLRGLDGPLLPHGGVETSPCRILDGDLQERLERHEGGPQGLVEREQPANQLLAYSPGIVAIVDAEVGVQELDQR